jgi:WD40 repeat protein
MWNRRQTPTSTAIYVLTAMASGLLLGHPPVFGQPPAGQLKLRLKETPLPKAPWLWSPGDRNVLLDNPVIVDEECQHFAFMDRRPKPADGQNLWIDNVKQEHPVNHWPAFSRDGKHVAYAADSGGMSARQRFVVLDGVPGTKYQAPLVSMTWSPRNSEFVGQPVLGGPDGKTLAYRATRGNAAFVVKDGVAGEEYEGIRGLAFSPDGQKLVYAATRGKKWRVIGSAPIGKEAEYDSVGFPEFSIDGRLAFQAKVGRSQFVVVDGVDGPKYEWASAPRFSPDGKHVAYFASHGGIISGGREVIVWCGEKCVVVVDGVEHAVSGVPGVLPGQSLSINNQGLLAYCYGKHQTTTKDGKPVIDKQTRWVAVVDGKEIVEAQSKTFFDPLGQIFFSPDGKRFAFRLTRAPDEKSFMVVDGQEQKGYQRLSDPVFSPDGRHVAYFAVDGRNAFLVVDGVELLGDQNVSAMFGPSPLVREDGLWPGSPTTWQIRRPVQFESPTVMHSFVFRGRDAVRMTMEIVE